MNIVIDLVVALLLAVVVFLVAGFLLGLVGVGAPWPSILGVAAGVLYFAERHRRRI